MEYTLRNVNPEPFILQLSRLCSHDTGLIHMYFNGLNFHMSTQQGLPYLAPCSLIHDICDCFVTSENMSVVKISQVRLPACASQNIFLTIYINFFVHVTFLKLLTLLSVPSDLFPQLCLF